MKGHRGPKQRAVCDTCLQWLLDDKLADVIELGRDRYASEQTTPPPCNDATTMSGGHPFFLITVAYHFFGAPMLVFDSEVAGKHTSIQQRACAMMLLLCRKAVFPFHDITSRIVFFVIRGGFYVLLI